MLIKVQIWVCLFLHVLRRKGGTKTSGRAGMAFAFVCVALRKGVFVVIVRVLDRESPPHKKGFLASLFWEEAAP